jgi:hypothetical protein
MIPKAFDIDDCELTTLQAYLDEEAAAPGEIVGDKFLGLQGDSESGSSMFNSRFRG